MNETIWDMAGMGQMEFSRLPWPEKSKLLRRHKGVGIADVCAGCGLRLHDAREQRRLASLPPQLRNHPFGLLFAEFYKDQAEVKRFKASFPGAAI
jgi:hypothetical protein